MRLCVENCAKKQKKSVEKYYFSETNAENNVTTFKRIIRLSEDKQRSPSRDARGA